VALPKAVALLAPAPAAEPGLKADAEPEASAPPPREEPPAFAINALQLCRNIQGFGAYETMDAQSLKAGRPVLIYCEPAGLRYERDGDAYVARVSTRVELIDPRDGSKVWDVAGDPVEDRCQSRRRDAFVGTRLNLPESIAPGAYTIRLIQTDDLAQQSATAEVAVTIGR
jgi:hypothetical protein